jgi:stress response protein SCP2
MASQLAKGANAPVQSADGATPRRVRVELAWGVGATNPAVSMVAVACDANGKALGAAHHVTYRAPSSIAGRDRFETLVDLDATPDDVIGIGFGLVSGDRSLAALPQLALSVKDEPGRPLIGYEVQGLAEERWLLVAELYRRGGQWKVRAVGQGGQEGRAGLFRSFGLTH